jgi:hypothetical protein
VPRSCSTSTTWRKAARRASLWWVLRSPRRYGMRPGR